MLRLVEVHAPPGTHPTIDRACEEASVLDRWATPTEDGGIVYRILVRTAQVEELTDVLLRDAEETTVRIVVLSVEATLPRIDEGDDESGSGEGGDEESLVPSNNRVSRDELLQAMEGAVDLSPVYLATVALSTVVAAVGLIRADVAVIIGAMVIAPLLGPNVALALAATLGDLDLAKRALRSNIVGVSVALAVSLCVGFLWAIDPSSPQLAARTQVGLSDVVLALAAGSAGALAFTTGLPTAVIGVMVAVALLPPLVVVGLLAGAGFFAESAAAATLLATNVTCVNLAGVATFLVRRVSPRDWADAERARRTGRMAITMWASTLALLIALIVFAW